MREAKFWAGLGTILIIAGIYCFKALPQGKISQEEYAERGNTVVNNRNKVLLILTGTIAIVSGILLLVKSFKDIMK